MRSLGPLWATLTALLLVGAPVTAQISDDSTDDATKEVTVVARESDCPDGETFCFSIEGDPPRLSPDDEVNLTLRNPDGNQADHNVHATLNESADAEHQDTDAEEAIANTSTIAPGETANANFTVPDGEALYLWCDMTGHEASGMWTTIEIQSDNGTENDTFQNDTRDNETAENDTRENDTTQNDTDQNNTNQNDTRESDSRENETSDNRSDRDDSAENRTRGSEDSDEDNPLEPTEGPEDGGSDGREAPFGFPALVVAVLAGAIGLSLARPHV